MWRPAAQCPQGHDSGWMDHPKAIGSLCHRCADAATSWDIVREHRYDPTWHPEWRLRPGDPVNWDAPAILWPRLRRLREHHARRLHVLIEANTGFGWAVSVSWIDGGFGLGDDPDPSVAAVNALTELLTAPRDHDGTIAHPRVVGG